MSNLARRLAYRALHPHLGGRRLLTQLRKQLDREWYARIEREVEYDVHWVSPNAIRHVSPRDFSHDYYGKILEGDWDLDPYPFEKLDFYESFIQVKQKGMPWSETRFYKNVMAKIQSGNPRWDCTSEEEFKQRLLRIEALYHDMRTLGYIPNNNQDQVTVNIGRYGDLLFNDGRHRLTFAKLLNISSIPIGIVVRHRRWIEFKMKIIEYARQKYGGKVYAPLMHPDLERIPSHYSHKRFEMIARHLPDKYGTMLDIGCHWGYFCHRFEDMGWKCTGVEYSEENFFFLERLRRASNRSFRIVNASIFDFAKNERCEYDIILALAIFHHFLVSEEDFQRLKQLLSWLDAREMYFLPPQPSESLMQRAYWNPSPQQFVEFILENSRFTRAQCLGYADDGRLMFKLTR